MNTIMIRPFAAVKLLTFAALALGGCHVSGIKGNGDIVTQNRPVQEFASVEAEGAFTIRLGAGSALLHDHHRRKSAVARGNQDGRIQAGAELARPTAADARMKVKLSSSPLTAARLTGAVRLNATQTFRQRLLPRRQLARRA